LIPHVAGRGHNWTLLARRLSPALYVERHQGTEQDRGDQESLRLGDRQPEWRENCGSMRGLCRSLGLGR